MNHKEKVVYQIYPKSFCDINGDGWGDIQGIISKLPYLEKLGVDFIWMTPIYPSLQRDNGYDVADYRSIDPRYGTMEDFEMLCKEAKKNHIEIMLDMVFNHTSTAHEWFQKALLGDPKYKNYYIFKKGKNGNPPTNWQSKFGGSAWEYVEKFDAYYLHLFDVTQADLNWENPDVRKEVTDIVKFWMDKGVKGFRFDVINLISKSKYEDDPNLYDGRQFYADGPKVHAYIHELNVNSFGNSDCTTVGELNSTTLDTCVQYACKDAHELDSIFTFFHLKVDYKNNKKWELMPFDFQQLKYIFHRTQKDLQENDSWSGLFWCNHDQPRALSRFTNDTTYRKQSAKMLATTIHMMRGTPYIYQGEEIGMTNHYFTSINQYRDVESINFYEILKQQGKSEEEIHHILQARSRDNARTPMQWDDSQYAGFSSHEPWIPVINNYTKINVQQALEDTDSIFYYYQKLIQLRKQYTVIQEGSYEPILEKHPTVLAYKRLYKDETLVVLNNFYEKTCTIDDLEISNYEMLIGNYTNSTFQQNHTLQPYESIVLYKKSQTK